MARKNPKDRHRVTQSVSFNLETLECRLLMDAGGGLERWTVRGTPRADAIVVSLDPADESLVRVTLDGVSQGSRPLAELSGIRVEGLGGGDAIRVELPEGVELPLTLQGGRGDDQIVGGGGANIIRAGRGQNLIYSRPGDRVHSSGRDVLLEAGGEPVLDSAQALRRYLADAAVGMYWDWFGQPSGGPLSPSIFSRGEGAVSFSMLSTATDFSTTNVQVAGVDEADLIKTDGQFIYFIQGQTLHVADALPAEAMSLVSTIELGGYATGLYLYDGVLTVISQTWEPPAAGELPVILGSEALFAESARIALPYWRWEPHVQVQQYDVSDPAAPALLETTELDGSLVDSRSVDGRVYVATTADLGLPQPHWLEGESRLESLREYRQRLLGLDIAELMPAYETVVGEGDAAFTGTMLDAELVAPALLSDGSLLSLSMFDPATGGAGPDDVSSILGSYGQVYASPESFYIVSNQWGHRWGGFGGSESHIHKFDLHDGGSDLAATGVVDGSLLNQFSMDEHAGLFRIATTQFAGTRSNNLFVLEQQGDVLNIVGQITGLAPTESIFAARFIGDTAYIVTFRQTDPLYVIDLSDPTDPQVAGELHIPGFSSYLHPIGDGLLIGLGRDADPTSGRTLGLKLSLFDVNDPAAPTELHNLVFPNEAWFSHSVAEHDHHAFSWFAEQGLLALPVQSGTWWEGSSGIQVFSVSPEGGFESAGQVEHDGYALRSLRIGDTLYSLSYGQLIASDLFDPSVTHAVLDLTGG